MVRTTEQCYICGTQVPATDSADLICHVTCELCGEYNIATPLLRSRGFTGDMSFVMGALRNLSAQGKTIPITADVEEVLRRSISEPSSVFEKIDLLLKHIARRTNSKPGAQAKFCDKSDFPLLFSDDRKEFRYHVDAAEELGWIDVVKPTDPVGCVQYSVTLALPGWRRLDEIQRSVGESNQAFVAMWFDASMDEAYEKGLKRGLEECNLVPQRIDTKEHNNDICDEIIAEIRRSRVLVADFTGHRPGVYFEAGFAMGLGIPVIFCCRQDEIEDAHFDTRQYNHIIWEDPEDLCARLIARVRATILV